MNFPENKPVDIGGITFNLIPYLTFDETVSIARICIEVYEEGVTNTENNKICRQHGWNTPLTWP
jgi:hypothetical protein